MLLCLTHSTQAIYLEIVSIHLDWIIPWYPDDTIPFHKETLHYLCSEYSQILTICLFTRNQAAPV